MNIYIVSVIPDLLKSPLNHSIIKRAQDKGLLKIQLVSLRKYGQGKHQQVDDYQYGGGAGMVLMCEPLAACIEDLQKNISFDEIIYLSPDGKPYKQTMANQLSLKKNLLLICGHYKGIDQRIRDQYITMEISIGDYVLSGGEIPACVLVDSIGRLLPGVLNNESSALTDSFQDDLLAPPVYTRPKNWRGLNVPDVLLSGNQKEITKWRYDESLKTTQSKRPDLFN